MWCLAAMMVWASDPVLRSPEDRLPIGAVARIGAAQFARPVRSQDQFFFTPDGRSIAIANSSGLANRPPVEWWDVATLKRVPPPFWLSADERIINITSAGIVTLNDRGYSLRDPKSGAIRFQIATTDRGFSNVNFALNGQLAFARDYEGQIWIFRRAADGQIVSNVVKEINLENLFAISASGNAITWVTGEEVKRYDTATGTVRSVMKMVEPMVVCNSLDVSPDGQTICMVRRDRNYDQPPIAELYVGQNPTPMPLGEPKKGDDSYQQRIRFTADGRSLVSLSYRGAFGWSSATGQSLWSYVGNDFYRSAISPDGKTILHSESEGCLHLIDSMTGREMTPTVARLRNIDFAEWLNESTAMAMCPSTTIEGKKDQPGMIYRWNPLSNGPIQSLPVDSREPWSPDSLSNDGQFVVVTRSQGDQAKYRVQEVEGGRVLHEWSDSTSDLTFIGPFLADNRRFVARREMQTALFAIDTLRPMVTFHSGKIGRRGGEESWAGRRMLITPDQRLVITPTNQTEIVGYELATGQRRYTTLLPFTDNRRGYGGQWISLALSADGKRLIVEYQSQTMLVNPATGKLERIFELPGRRRNTEVLPLALSRTGRWFATIRTDIMDITIYDLDSERFEPIRTFRGATGSITKLAFSPDDRYLLSTSTDGTAVTWDLRTLAQHQRPTEDEPSRLWSELGGEAATAAPVIRAMIDREPKRAIDVISSQWITPTGIDPGELTNAIRDLDSPDYLLRERAQLTLRQNAEQALPLLKPVSKSARSAEVRARVRTILDEIEGAERNPDRLRWLRAIEVLERIGSAPAQTVLQQIAKAPPYLKVAQEAKAALDRLKSR